VGHLFAAGWLSLAVEIFCQDSAPTGPKDTSDQWVFSKSLAAGEALGAGGWLTRGAQAASNKISIKSMVNEACLFRIANILSWN
jgi:hypothetical protein